MESTEQGILRFFERKDNSNVSRSMMRVLQIYRELLKRVGADTLAAPQAFLQNDEMQKNLLDLKKITSYKISALKLNSFACKKLFCVLYPPKDLTPFASLLK